MDLSSQLRLQPGHVYGAATEQHGLDECTLGSASQKPDLRTRLPLTPRGRILSWLQKGWLTVIPSDPASPVCPPRNTLRARDVESFAEILVQPKGITHLLWGNRAQHRGVANTRLGKKSTENVCEAEHSLSGPHIMQTAPGVEAFVELYPNCKG